VKKIRVWDLPLRLFHWTLVLLVVAAIVAQKLDAMLWHFRFGYAALALVLFRIVWGLVGSKYARFSEFIKGRRAVVAYIKGMRGNSAVKSIGHNPLGSLSVVALLAIVLIQAVSGLFSSHHDDHGPLAKFISVMWSKRIAHFHADVSGTLIYNLVGLHVAAIAYYYFINKEDLVTPMVTGDKDVDVAVPATNDSWGMRLLALAILLVCAAGVYVVVTL
jgi:cytochrome b